MAGLMNPLLVVIPIHEWRILETGTGRGIAGMVEDIM